jgi:hypothetical protein
VLAGRAAGFCTQSRMFATCHSFRHCNIWTKGLHFIVCWWAGTTLHPCEWNDFPVSDKLDLKIHAAAQKSLQRVAKLQAEWATVNWSDQLYTHLLGLPPQMCILSALCISQYVMKIIILSNWTDFVLFDCSITGKDPPHHWTSYFSFLWPSFILSSHMSLCFPGEPFLIHRLLKE